MKEKCKNCNKKLKKDYEFCPDCGKKVNSYLKEEWGMLGKEDFDEEKDLSSLMGELNSGLLGKMLNNAMRMLEKEISRENSNSFAPNTKFRLMINGKEITPPEIKKSNPKLDPRTKIMPIEFSKENQEKFSKFKKVEPKSNLRRFGNILYYELEVPGVNSLKEISIIRLENGLEVRAITKNKAYQKTIAISLPLTKYSLKGNILSLELKAEE